MSFHDNPTLPPDPEPAPVSDPAAAGAPPQSASTTPFVVADPGLVSFSAAQRRMSDPSVAEDLRVPWGWLDIVILVVATVIGLFVLGVLAVVAFGLTGGTLQELQNSQSLQGFIGVIVQAILDVALVGYLALHLRLRYRQPFWRTIGWRPLETTRFPKAAAYCALVMGGFIVAIIVTMTSNLVPPKGELPIQQLLADRTTAILFAVMSVAIAPIFEETAFRGYLYPVVARRFGVGAGVVFTGLVFGLLHAAQLSGAWFQVALLIGVGIIFTLARAVTRTVAASFVLHISYNSLQVLALVLDTHGFRQMSSLH